jgi:hypothetical protein
MIHVPAGERERKITCPWVLCWHEASAIKSKQKSPGNTCLKVMMKAYSQRGAQWAIFQAVKTGWVSKDISLHTLRHAYDATLRLLS